MEAFKTCNVDPAFYANRRREFDEILPWDHIEPGVSKAFLKKEMERALAGTITPDCRKNCSACGITSVFGGGVCHVATAD